MAKNETETKKKGVFLRTLHYYWQEVKKYKWLSLISFLLTPVVVFVRGILGPLIFADMIGKISDGIPKDQIVATLLPEALFYFVCYAINQLVLHQIRVYTNWKMEILSMYDLYNLCFDTISAQSMQFHNDRFSGSLVSQTNKFVGAFERLIDELIWNVLPVICDVIFIMIVLWPLLPWYAILLLIFFIAYGLVAWISSNKIAYHNERVAEAENKQTGQLSDSISNMLSVKSYANESYERQRFANFTKKTYSANLSSIKAYLKRALAFDSVNSLLIGLILAILLFGSDWFGVSVATLILVVNYSQSILNHAWDLTSIFKNFNRVAGDAREMTLILDMPDEVVDADDAKTLNLQQAKVDFDSIAFQHSDAKRPVFQNFSLKIHDGERVGLVGISGSGKTTLTKLLLRFADVNAGKIMISDQDIRNTTQESLRANIAYVPQETSLFHRSIAENIAYGKPDATPEEVQRAAKLANAHDFIMELPEGYDTLVGERGIKLSGGQRQRIAIARAILKDAPILVLDEATSALDSESEALIQDALNKLMAGRTSIVIAHRLSTVANLDRILVLENGKIVEEGNHHDLLEKPDGVYYHLWSRQSGAFMED